MHEPAKSMIQYRLDPSLRGLVKTITGYREQGLGLRSNPEYASLTVPLLIGFRAPFTIRFGSSGKPRDVTSFASGLYPGTVYVDSQGDAECVQVNFTPMGARRFFGMPMSEFGGQLTDLEDLEEKSLRKLREQLGELMDPAARLRLAERYVIQRLHSRTEQSTEVEHAFSRLIDSSGKTRISEITEDLGWSRKRLSRVFREEVGETPKTIARIARFQHALLRLRSDKEINLALLAFDCGYSDQAHMTREFTAFSGTSPGEFRVGN